MKLYVARHGETAWNNGYLVCGSTDLPLTEKGMEQAMALAELVKGKGIEAIVASPMIRAVQTARPAAEALKLPVETDPNLREQDYGIYEGKRRDDPGFLANKRQFAARYPGGESHLDLACRVYAALRDIHRRYPDKTVLIVCHGAVCRTIRSFFRDMTNEDYFSYSPDNASLEEYEW